MQDADMLDADLAHAPDDGSAAPLFLGASLVPAKSTRRFMDLTGLGTMCFHLKILGWPHAFQIFQE